MKDRGGERGGRAEDRRQERGEVILLRQPYFAVVTYGYEG
jgi:hypothetical protein